MDAFEIGGALEEEGRESGGGMNLLMSWSVEGGKKS